MAARIARQREGNEVLRGENDAEVADADGAAQLGHDLADEFLARGAGALLVPVSECRERAFARAGAAGAGPAAGVGVIVTRPARQAAGLVAQFAALGASPIVFPAIVILPPAAIAPARARRTRRSIATTRRYSSRPTPRNTARRAELAGAMCAPMRRVRALRPRSPLPASPT